MATLGHRAFSSEDQVKAIIGAELSSFPLGPLQDGRAVHATGHDSVREVIWNLLATRPGERLMRPTFGIGLHDFVHQPNNEATRRSMADAIHRGLTRWEPRIKIEEVRVRPDPQFLDEVSISILYRLRRDSSQNSFDLSFKLGS